MKITVTEGELRKSDSLIQKTILRLTIPKSKKPNRSFFAPTLESPNSNIDVIQQRKMNSNEVAKMERQSSEGVNCGKKKNAKYVKLSLIQSQCNCQLILSILLCHPPKVKKNFTSS